MIVDGMEVLSQRQLSADAKEGVTLVRSKFDAIADSFNDIEYLQVYCCTVRRHYSVLDLYSFCLIA